MVQEPVAIRILVAAAIGLVSSGCTALRAPEPVPIVRVDQLDELPTIREWPVADVVYKLGGPLIVQSVLDTSGHLTKDMILDLEDPSRDLSGLEADVLSKSVFSRPRVHGEPRRALVELTLDLNNRTAIVLPRLSDRIAWIESMVDEKPEVLSGPHLSYPDDARRAGITGRVIVQAIIGPDGRAEPATVRIVQRVHNDLDFEAIRYVQSARFKPARIAGRPVRTLVNLPIDFKIRRSIRVVRP